ncbi:MAG: helix-turn-helix domain-containing protein [Dehalococcoidia bacterium]
MVMPEPEKLCYTVEEAAAKLQICRSLAYRQVKDGRIPAIRFGRCVRIPKARLDKMLERGGIDTGN